MLKFTFNSSSLPGKFFCFLRIEIVAPSRPRIPLAWNGAQDKKTYGPKRQRGHMERKKRLFLPCIFRYEKGPGIFRTEPILEPQWTGKIGNESMRVDPSWLNVNSR